MRHTIIPLLMLWCACSSLAQTVCNDSHGLQAQPQPSTYTPALTTEPQAHTLTPQPQPQPLSHSQSARTAGTLHRESTYEDTTHRETIHRYDSPNLRKGWNIDLQIGTGAFIGTPTGCGTIISRIRPSFRAHVGKWFTPSVGSRLSWEGSALQAADRVIQHYQAFHMDILWNLAPMLSEKNNFTLAPYFGTGCIWNQSIGHAPMALSCGVTASIKVSKHFWAVLELGALSTFKYFDGIAYQGSKPCSYYRNPRMGDNLVNFTIGLSYTLPSGKNPNKDPSSSWDKEWNAPEDYTSGSRDPREECPDNLKRGTITNRDSNSLTESDLCGKDSDNPSKVCHLYTTGELLALVELSNQAKRLQEQNSAERDFGRDKSGLESEGYDCHGTDFFTPTEREEDNPYNQTENKGFNDGIPTEKEEADYVSPTENEVINNDIPTEEGEADHVSPTENEPLSAFDTLSRLLNQREAPIKEETPEYESDPYSDPLYETCYESQDGDFPVEIIGDYSEDEGSTGDEDPNNSDTEQDRDNASKDDLSTYNTMEWFEAELEAEFEAEFELEFEFEFEFETESEVNKDEHRDKDPSGPIYGEGILLNPTISQELEELFRELNELNHHESWVSNSETGHGAMNADDQCSEENLQLCWFLESYRSLTERLMEIVGMGKDPDKDINYLWVDDSLKEQSPRNSIQADAVEGKRQNSAVYEDSLGSEVPVEDTLQDNAVDDTDPGTCQENSLNLNLLTDSFKIPVYDQDLNGIQAQSGTQTLKIEDNTHMEEGEDSLWATSEELEDDTPSLDYNTKVEPEPSEEDNSQAEIPTEEDTNERPIQQARFNIIYFKPRK